MIYSNQHGYQSSVIAVTNEDFKIFFEQYGPVLDSVVMFDRDTNNSRGFGFVTFKDVAVAQAVLGGPDKTNNMVTIQEKECEVKVSVPKKLMDSRRSDRRCKHKYRDDNYDSNKHVNRTDRNARNMNIKDDYSYESAKQGLSNVTNENYDTGDNLQAGERSAVNLVGQSYENPQPPYYFDYLQGNMLPMSPYVDHAAMMMYPRNLVSPAQSLSPVQPQPPFEPNNAYPTVPFVPNDINPASYQHFPMSAPYVAYSYPFPQMAYPLMIPPQYGMNMQMNNPGEQAEAPNMIVDNREAPMVNKENPFERNNFDN